MLDLDGLVGAGLSKLQEIAGEIGSFKASGKPVIAVGDGYTRDQYYLAAQADEVYLHPMGLVLVDGYSRFLPYYKSLLDKVYVDYNVWTVGEYKSFVEPITRDDMSPQDEEASRVFLGALWTAYQSDVTAARELAAPALQQYADDIVTLLQEAGGDTARLAVDYGLVGELVSRDAMRESMHEAVEITACAPAQPASSEAGSFRSPVWSSTPLRSSRCSFSGSEVGRIRARTGLPAAARCRQMASPSSPVAPTTVVRGLMGSAPPRPASPFVGQSGCGSAAATVSRSNPRGPRTVAIAPAHASG